MTVNHAATAAVSLLIISIMLFGCAGNGPTVNDSPLKKQVRNDIYYLMTSEQKKALKQAATDDEVSAFLETFWANLDPTPETATNEARVEFENRLRYVKEHFTEWRGGRKSDRARVYLLYGPPTYVEKLEWSKFRLSHATQMGEMEAWIYNQHRGSRYIPTIFGDLYPNQTYFIFARLNNPVAFEQIYSTVPGEKIDSRTYATGY